MGKEKVVVGMSGGVDSTVAAYLLKKQGYEVIGVTMEMWPGEGIRKSIEDASRAAKTLGISYEVLDFKKEFREKVVENFMESYEKGETPNPCIVCNEFVKGKALLDKAKEMGAEHIATGHYARVEKHPVTGRYTIRNSVTAKKDQTYVLYRMSQEQLSGLLLPIGAFEKDDVRKIAEGIDGFIAHKSDSQDICFIPDGDYVEFIKREGAYRPVQGNFVDLEGNILGKHKGLIHYTVGQRKGLGVSFGKPMFVYGARPEKNEILLSDNKTLFRRTLYAGNLAHMCVERFEDGARYRAKMRYAHKPSWCTVRMAGEDVLEVTFDEPQRAVTPGQSLVLYDGEYVAGGGFILPELL